MQHYELEFFIAGTSVALISDELISITREFQPFVSSGEPCYTAQFKKVTGLPVLDAEIIHKELVFDVAQTKNGEIIHLFRAYPDSDGWYAIGRYDWANKLVEVSYLPEGSRYVSESNNAFFHINWEMMMLRERRLIFHACCVTTGIGGILFSGPSGIGKSTQGALWCRYEGARLINGDRPILYEKDGIWTAFGSPYAGSSECYVNDSAPITAIIMLKQAERCSICRLNTSEAFRRVFSQLTVGCWDAEDVGLACNLAERLVMSVPVYELACTPDRAAVELLKNTLGQKVME